jgi:hypothetical protein
VESSNDAYANTCDDIIGSDKSVSVAEFAGWFSKSLPEGTSKEADWNIIGWIVLFSQDMQITKMHNNVIALIHFMTKCNSLHSSKIMIDMEDCIERMHQNCNIS